ncbi:MAG: class I SAM-dependent methyltransferase [Actinobacteria bacterium]|nr:class I SAM-dependent methyltransferase [Actinomycetota bacterium]
MLLIKQISKKVLFKLFGEKNVLRFIGKISGLMNIKMYFAMNPNNLPKHRHLTYDADGLATVHNCDFLLDPLFVDAYRNGMSASYKLGNDLHIEWRAYVACWAADYAKDIDGDYVECGCYTGILSKTVVSYIQFEKMQHKRFFLFDSFKGINLDFLTEAEQENIHSYRSKNERLFCGNYYEIAKNNFENYKNVMLVKGYVPESLSTVEIDKVCYLSIDMNAAYPEVEALKYFWGKLIPGAIVILDDYGFKGHSEQKKSIDSLGKMIGFSVLTLPTGQGLIIKS